MGRGWSRQASGPLPPRDCKGKGLLQAQLGTSGLERTAASVPGAGPKFNPSTARMCFGLQGWVKAGPQMWFLKVILP